MRKKLSKSFLFTLIFIAVLTSALVIPARAQSPTITPTPASSLTPTQTQNPSLGPALVSTPTPTAVQFANPNVVTFSQLQQGLTGDIVLSGPLGQDGLAFALPANWALNGGPQLDLVFGVSYNSVIQNQSNSIVVGGGTLNIFLNDKLLTTLQLNEVGEVESKIAIPLAAFDAVRRDGVHILWFRLESADSCRFFGQNTTVFIHPTSFLTLPHNIVQPSTSLVNFPRPIIQNSFVPDAALVVVPDQPSAAELQAALTTAAGLSKLSSNRIVLDMTTSSNFKKENASDKHVILVGKAGSLALLDGLRLPLPVTNGQFQFPNGNPDDGLVELIVSPWSSPHVALVISANTDQGIIKAAQAVSTGVLRPNRSQNFAVVEQVSLAPVSSPQAVDSTLANFGYPARTFSNRGYDAEQYIFNIPAGMSVSSDAYFEMVYGHSALIDYDSSEIVIELNGQPIGSVRMSDATASLPTNKIKIMIPPSVVRPGDNRLSVIVYLLPIDECAPPDARGLWVNVWPESTLHLPQIAISTSPFSSQNLADYPSPFTQSPVLESTAIVLEQNNLESWRSALQIAAYLGWQSSGSVVAFSVYYGDGMPVTERTKYNLLVIGRPSQMPIVSEMNDYLPAPFSIGSDNASESNNFQVTYRIPSDSPMGYIEMIQSPWNPNNVVLPILGNTTQGVVWAASALIDPILRSRVAGNFVVVNDRQILSADTRSPLVTTENISTPVSNVVVAPPSIEIPSSPTIPQDWALPALILTVIVIILISAFVMIRSWLRNRTRRKSE